MRDTAKRAILLAVAAVCAVSMWHHTTRVWRAAEADDFYPRWHGVRAVLLEDKNPYSDEVTRDIQRRQYGRAIDEFPPDKAPRDEQRFAYPLFIVFLIAPLALLPYAAAMAVLKAVLLAAIGSAAVLSMRYVGWRAPALVVATVAVLCAFSAVMLEGLQLGQLSLLIPLFLSASLLAASRRRPLLSGAVLVPALIKPQLFVLVMPMLLIWTAADLRQRWRWGAGFAASAMAFILAAMLLQPGWPLDFVHGTRRYVQYTPGTSWIAASLAIPWLAKVVEAALTGIALLNAWRVRRHAIDSQQFLAALNLVAAVTLLVIPTFAPHGQALLLPGIIGLVHHRRALASLGRLSRVLLLAIAALLAWQWASAFVMMMVALFAGAAAVRPFWLLPFWTIPMLPLPLAVLALTWLRGLRMQEKAPVHEPALTVS